MDIVTMNILYSTMVSICREMGITLMKTSYSTIFNEALDFTCGLADADGRLIACAEFCPAQIGSIESLIHNCVQEFPKETMRPGDIILHNDVFRGGLHIPEHTVFKPIFVNDKLVAYAIAIGHLAEIGGKSAGGFSGDSIDVFQEGLRVPPVKIVKEGKDDVDLWKMYLANVRTPRFNYGDIKALISAVDLGENRVIALINKYGKEVFLKTSDDLLDYTERRMRAEISEMKDGVYAFEDYIEDDGTTDQKYTIKVELHINGSEIIADFTGSSPQAPGPINCTYTVALAATYNTLLHITDHTLPKNSGAFRPVKVIAPAGTVVNVDYPGPSVGGNTEGHPRIASVLFGAFSQACPEKVMASEGGTHTNFVFGAWHEDYEEYVACYDLQSNGWGGRSFADGNTMVDAINGNCRSCPAEVFETRFPWIIEEWSLLTDSGGAGKYRGGLGGTKLMRSLGEIHCSQVSDRHQFPAFGLFGGESGGLSGTLIQKNGSDEWGTTKTLFNRPSSSKFSGVVLKKGDRIRMLFPGGGGYGHPKDRNPEKVRSDLAEGLISERAAKEIYGLDI